MVVTAYTAEPFIVRPWLFKKETALSSQTMPL